MVGMEFSINIVYITRARLASAFREGECGGDVVLLPVLTDMTCASYSDRLQGLWVLVRVLSPSWRSSGDDMDKEG